MMERQGHKLTELTGNVLPEHIIFVDTETTQIIKSNKRVYHKLMLGVCIYARFRRDGKKDYKEIYRFTTEEDFWSYIFSKCLSKTVLYLISHNAVFDFTVLHQIRNLTSEGYEVGFVYEGGMTFIAKWKKKKHTIMILDNANWFAGKLAKWGKELDLPKLEMPDKTSKQDKWFIYCERDTEILYQMSKWYFAFLKDNDLGNWKYTIASSAFTSFRHRFMRHNIYIPAQDEDSDIARSSYHGGRTECFQVGQYNSDTFYKIDINSMYPYVMKEYEYPTCFEQRLSNANIDKLYYSTDTKAIIADCTIKPTEPYFVYKQNERNVYPIGTFRTTLTTEEYILAYENDWVRSVHDVCTYRKRKIFREYVDFFYGIKTKATMANKRLLRAFSKLYLNSLYGKFGQRGYVDRIIGQDNDTALRISYGYNARTRERYVLRQIGKTVIYSSKEGESFNAFCAIASHVTANSRLYLYDTILRIERQNCYYCDTDSVIINSVGIERIRNLLDNTKLGYWKIEAQADNIEIVAPKHYRFGAKIVMKGVRKDAKKLSDNTYEQEIWPGYNSILRQGDEEYYNLIQVKTLNPQIQSGILQNDGYVRPYEIRAN